VPENHGDDLNDSLNKINRADARGGRTHWEYSILL
jgi:hypothetical protein